MDSINQIKKLMPDTAEYFVDSALRHFCQMLLDDSEALSIIGTYKAPFQAGAREYLIWEDTEIKQKLERLDRQQTDAVRELLGITEVDEKNVDWDAVEAKVDALYPTFGLDDDGVL